MVPGERRVRVLHVIWSAGFGGVERLVLDLVNVHRLDADLDVALCFVQDAGGSFEPALRATGIPLHSLGLRSGLDLSSGKCRAAADLFRQFDILHVHVFNPLAALAMIWSGRIVLYTLHGPFANGRALRWTDRLNRYLLGRFLNRQVRFVTFNSRATARMTRHDFGLDAVNSAVIYNGISFASAATAGDGPDAAVAARLRSRFVVGTSTRLAAFKRIDRLIEGFALFAHRHPGAILLIVGDGSLRGELEALVAARGIGAQTIFAGFRLDVKAWQQAMSICVFPSCDEPFGLVSVEALSLGKPAIVFGDGGGLVEVVFGCTQTDVVDTCDELAQRLEYYLQRPEELAGAAESRRTYARRFDITAMARQFRELYLSLWSGAH